MMYALFLIASAPAASATCDAKPFTLGKPTTVKVAAKPVAPRPKAQPPKPKTEPMPEKPRLLADCDKPAKK